MSENATRLVWGTAFDKQQKMRSFIEKQEVHNADLLGAVQQQTAVLQQNFSAIEDAINKMASRQEQDRHLTRMMPSLLFNANEHYEVVSSVVKELLNEDNTIAPLECVKMHSSLKQYFNVVDLIEEPYIPDFAQKKMLRELRNNCKQMIDSLESVVPITTRDSFMAYYIKKEFSDLSRFTQKEALKYLTSFDAIDKTKKDKEMRIDSLIKYPSIFALVSLPVMFILLFHLPLVGGIGIAAILFLGITFGCYVASTHADIINEAQRAYNKLNSVYPLERRNHLIELYNSAKWVNDRWVISDKYINKYNKRFGSLWVFDS